MSRAAVTGHGDATSRAWVRRLSAPGADRDTVATELHALLLRAARFEIGRRRSVFPQLGGADLDDLAWQSADDALMSVLRRLGDFRGVELVLTGVRADIAMSAMHAHLMGCSACRDDHDSLLAFARTDPANSASDRPDQ